MGCTLSDHNHVGCSTDVIKTGTSASKTNGSLKVEGTPEGRKDMLRGDVTKRHEAKKDREKRLREKQKNVAIRAEELSNLVLEEKEMLSLTSRSRATSRATSRTASPRESRRQVAFKPCEPEIASVSGTDRDVTSGHSRLVSVTS